MRVLTFTQMRVLMLVMAQKLLDSIEQFLTETGMGDFQFGMKAASNGRLVERLRSGSRVWPETESRVRAFIRSERKRRATPSQDRETAA